MRVFKCLLNNLVNHCCFFLFYLFIFYLFFIYYFIIIIIIIILFLFIYLFIFFCTVQAKTEIVSCNEGIQLKKTREKTVFVVKENVTCMSLNKCT